VTTATRAHNRCVIDDRHLGPVRRVVATLASVRHRHVVGRFSRGGDPAAAGMTTGAARRRAFKRCVGMTALTVSTPMSAGQLEASRHMVEPIGDRRLYGQCAHKAQQRDQHQP